MSEYQFVAFRAIDRPVSSRDLEFMRSQSSRAEITPWSFENEYHFGDFRGDADEMLRRGYDLHLHFAKFGILKLMIRFPHGLPKDAVKPYLIDDALCFRKKKSGPGDILSIEPSYETDSINDLFDVEELLDDLVLLRDELIEGDLRPLYLAHLAVGCDSDHDPEETLEAPVPAGLDKLTAGQKALCRLFGLSDSIVKAAAVGAPALALRNDVGSPLADWLRDRPAATKDAWLFDWLSDPHSALRAKVLAEFRAERTAPLWPTACLKRTVASLQEAATALDVARRKKAADQAEKARRKRLAAMKADPQPTLRKVESLVKERGTAYNDAALLLSELREALEGTPQAGLADQHAVTLRQKHPTLRRLVGALRQQGFLPK